MRRTIGTVALALVVALFGMMWGAAPGHAQGCFWYDQNAELPIMDCDRTQGESVDFGHLSPLHVRILGHARMGQVHNFTGSTVTIEAGAEITSRDNYPGVYAPNGTNNTVVNYGNVTTIRLAGNDNTITNYGTFRQTEGNPHSYTVAVEGTTSVLNNELGGLITGRTGVRSTDARYINNHGTIEGTTRAIEVQGSSGVQSTIITNTGTISTPGGAAIRRFSGAERNMSVVNSGDIDGSVLLDGPNDAYVTNETGGKIDGTVRVGEGDDQVINEADATITGDVGLGDGDDTLTNAGTIEGAVTSGPGTSDIENTGSIGRMSLGSGADDVRNEAGATVAGNLALGGGDDKLVNRGQIDGAVTSGSGTSNTTNQSTIGSFALGAGNDTVTNTTAGTISGNVGLGGGDDELHNSGRIEGTVTAGAGTSDTTNAGFIDRIRLGAGDDTVTNTNTGLIDGNVDLGNGDNLLTNSGTIGGNVITGTGFDQVDIQGTLRGNVSGGSGVDHVTVGSDAQVIGSVLLGEGNDELILQEWDGSQILGVMDGGDGDDRLILEGGEGTLLTSGFRNFENVTVRDEGEWTISGSIPTSGSLLDSSTFAALWLQGDGNTVTYGAGNEIAVAADDGLGVFVDGNDNTFANDGDIRVAGDDANGVSVAGDGNTLTNAATGSIAVEGVESVGVGMRGAGNSFTNDGAVSANGDGSIGFASDGNDNELVNNDRIEATGDEATGILVTGVDNVVINSAAGSIVAEGDDALGVYIEGAGNEFNNDGTVEALGDDAATAVVVENTAGDANVITNTGTIRAETTDGESVGIVTTGNGSSEIYNKETGLIEADIAIDAGGIGHYTLSNEGTIRGDIHLGLGDHVVTNVGLIDGDIHLNDGGNHEVTNTGTLDGDILLGTGDDEVELTEDSVWAGGTIDLGSGTDEVTYHTGASDMTEEHYLDGGDSGTAKLILVGDDHLHLTHIDNFDTLELEDAGTWQFHNNVGFDNHITADAGDLILGNTDNDIVFGTGGLTIGSDARLSGTGTITGDVTIHGTIAPGHSFGVLDVNGNYTQAAGSTYEAEMAIDGRRDLIHATGTATIDGDTLLDITAEYGYYDPTDRWNVLKADGGVTGTYGSAEWDIDLLFLGPEATTEGDNVYIDLVHAGPSFASVAGTPNQKAVAAALDAAEAAEVGDEVVNLVLPALHIDDARQAYDSLHGEIYAQHRWVTLSSTQDFVDAANRGVNANGDTRSVWATAFKGMGTVDSQGKYMETKHDHFGLALGWTAWAQDEWGVGLLGGFGSSNVSLADAASASTASGYKFGAYAQYDNGFLGVTAQVVAGQDTFSVQRDMELLGNPLDDRAAEAEYDSSNMAVSLAGSLNYKVGEYDVKPTLGLNWFSVSRDKFTEKGAAGANLVVEADEFSIAQGALGVTINAPVAEGETYAPQFRVGYVTNFGEFESDFKAAFAAAGDVPFTIGGETPGDSGFVAGGSIVGETGKEGLTYELSYDGRFLGSATVHTFGGMLGYSF